MRVMPALAVSMQVAYQVAMDLLCLFILTFPLVQVFTRAISFTVQLYEWAAESLGPLAPQPVVSLPQTVEMGSVPG